VNSERACPARGAEPWIEERTLLPGNEKESTTVRVNSRENGLSPRDAQREGAPHQLQKVRVSKDTRAVGKPCAYPTYPCTWLEFRKEVVELTRFEGVLEQKEVFIVSGTMVNVQYPVK
jgi:hypothetical protein